MRKKIVAGNWKMNLSLSEGEELVVALKESLSNDPAKDVDVIVCSPFIHLGSIARIAEDSELIIGAQNCSNKESGAFTGETSASMISSAGAEYVIIGHSERRTYFNEDDQLLAQKVNRAIEKKLKVIFCCGEVLKDREEGKYFEIVKEQINKGLFEQAEHMLSEIVIAYEPVWAIGTGVTASSDQAQEMHRYIRTLIENKYGKDAAENISILYGGSCNPKNAGELFSMPDVDGGLIGGASLKADDFIKIINSF